MRKITLILAALLCLTGIGNCAEKSSDAKWHLVWSDEFDKDGRPDPAKWQPELAYRRNNELQYYTARPENVRVEKGNLVLETRKERVPLLKGVDSDPMPEGAGEPGFAHYTSASVTTQGKFALKYGRVEVRAKLPRGLGFWPAIWMLGVNVESLGWPDCGEIDIMENVGFNPELIHASIHTASYNHPNKTQKTATKRVPDAEGAFHVYALEWDEKRIRIFADNDCYFTFENEGRGSASWPFDKPHYLLLNVAYGGSWGGEKGIDDSKLPDRMEVDYVRVFEAAKTH